MLYIQLPLILMYVISKYPTKLIAEKIALEQTWWLYPHTVIAYTVKYLGITYIIAQYWLGYTIYWWIWHAMIPVARARMLIISWIAASLIMPIKLIEIINAHWFLLVHQKIESVISFMYTHDLLVSNWQTNIFSECITMAILSVFMHSMWYILMDYYKIFQKYYNTVQKWSRKKGVDKTINTCSKIIKKITRSIVKITNKTSSIITKFLNKWWEEKGVSYEDYLIIINKNTIHHTVSLSNNSAEKTNEDIAENNTDSIKTILLPSVDLLVEGKSQQAIWDQDARLAQLKIVLNDYNIHGDIIGYNIGPVVTLYKLQPEPGMKESQIIGLGADIARSMSALSVRIASIPGHNLIGIEISNPVRQTVYLRDLIESSEFQKSKGLALALGCDIAGKPFIANLETAPHMLIAGTTGSGKSVSIHTLLLSLLYKHTPDTCRLIMIDPKMLELAMYKDIPHLLVPVVTNPKLAVVALKWAIQEMESRYELMSQMQVRNITEYNNAVMNGRNEREVIQEDGNTHIEKLEKIPYIVIIVDEFADLMLVAGKDIDESIQRLAQMARAAGIHLILATQRPSVDVITGTIKANFPTRLTFQLASKIDSRTILGDRGGADQLLGKGDMLYLNLNHLVRAHGPYVSNEEVEAVVAHWKSTYGKPEYMEITLKAEDEDGYDSSQNIHTGGSSSSNNNANIEEDDMFEQVVEYVYRTKRATASSIQREFNIGFNRAAGYLDRLEKAGKITAPDNMGRRRLIG